MPIAKPPLAWADEPTKTTPINAARLEYEGRRTQEVQEEVERMIAAGAVTTSQYGATGAGTSDETAAFQAFLDACKERAGVVLPGKFRIDGNLKVRVASEIAGLNGRTSIVEKKGNGDLFDLEEGFITIRNLFVRAAEEQASGNAFELVGAGGGNVRMDSITGGNNFFNVFSLIPTTVGGSIHISRIRITDLAEGVKGIKGAVFVLGNSANRMVGAILEDIQGVAAKKSGVGKWLEANNCDSCWLANILFQTGTQGVVIGNNDTSAERTTNMQFVNVTCDGGTEGMSQGWFVQSAFATDLVACHGQGAEMYLGENVHGFSMAGGALQMCQNNGLRLGGAAGSPMEFTGVKIGNNNITLPAGTATNLETSNLSADVLVENGAARALFTACMLGNVMNYGGVCRSYYPFWFGSGAKTGNCTLIMNNGSAWAKSGNSVKAFFNDQTAAGVATNNIAGFGGASPALPVPIVW